MYCMYILCFTWKEWVFSPRLRTRTLKFWAHLWGLLCARLSARGYSPLREWEEFSEVEIQIVQETGLEIEAGTGSQKVFGVPQVKEFRIYVKSKWEKLLN